MANKGLSTEPYKGVRDFYPEDQFIQNYLFGVMRKTVESFGYSEYNASILEPTELYKGKTSEEIVNDQTYSFTDRGEREVTLRPEMTPTVARMIAGKRRDIAFPARWYSIPNVFRYERPQRGRLREHWQLNCDLFGVKGLEAETEAITLAYRLMRNFGATDTDFEIRINSRVSLNESLTQAGLSPEKIKEMIRLIDRKDKIADFDEQASLIAGNTFTLPTTEPDDVAHLRRALNELGMTNVVYSPSLARGFDYYTGIVFEVFDTNPDNNRSLFGGGRYDNLLTLFGQDPLPAVGFGMGDVTMRDFLEVRGLLPTYAPKTSVYLAVTSPHMVPEAMKLAEELRKNGVHTAIDFGEKKLGDQIKTADKQRIPFIVVVGENEVKNNIFSVKNLATGEEKTVQREGLAELLR